ncbi:hypothetical protein ACH5RR_022992 [Cinchona calisaya]|uniref:HD-Zip IV C-terminal domain-containing protein n=1 Tax=Cinchona calisaya TaxID=153742 RepID=A0ABD2ZCT3_9GENT
MQLVILDLEELIRVAELGFPLWISFMDTGSYLLNEDAYYNIFPKAIGLKPTRFDIEASKGINVVMVPLLIKNAHLKFENEKFHSENIKLRESLTKTSYVTCENARLKVENEKFRSEDIKLRESLTKASCVTWCNPQAIVVFFLDEHQLKVENSRFKEECENSREGPTQILQECGTHPICFYIVYAPVDNVLTDLLLIGGNLDHVELLPSRFIIYPSVLALASIYGRAITEVAREGRSLVAVAFQILVNSVAL